VTSEIKKIESESFIAPGPEKGRAQEMRRAVSNPA